MEKEKYIKKIKEKYTFSQIQNIINSMKNLKVMVIGDTIIDEYCFVNQKGRAMKDPMLSVDFIKDDSYAGGILAIANHISDFVEEVKLITLLGDDYDKKEFVQEHLHKNVNPEFFVKENSPTIRKRRYVSTVRNEKLFKIEYINDQPIKEQLESQILDYLDQNLSKYDLVVVGDFGHGFISSKILSKLEEKAKFLSVNVQTNSANLGFNYITKCKSPSFATMDGLEIQYAVGDRYSDYINLLNKLHETKGFDRFLVTLGKQGVAYYDQGHIITSPGVVTSTKDVVGAGDALFAITSLLVYIKTDRELVPFLANCVGGIAVNIMGNKRSVTKQNVFDFVQDVYKEVEESDINDYFNSVNSTLKNLNKQDISNFVNLLLDAYHNERNIYVFGNGGSAATASHFCGDLVKGVSYGLDKRFRAICLSDNIPSIMAIANDISYDDIFIEQLKNFLNNEDLVIGISGSGNSINVVKALEYANGKNAKTVAICGYKGGKIKEIADLSIHAEVDDMEISEDIHNLVMIHTVKRLLSNQLNNGYSGDKYEKRVTKEGPTKIN